MCCASERSFSGRTNTDLFTQAPADRVDILFVVDDSRSMAEEQAALASGFTTFLDELAASETDWQIGVVSTSLPDAGDPPLEGTSLVGDPPVLVPGMDAASSFAERAQMGISGSDHEKGLQAAVDALNNSKGFVRVGANLVVIFVTDEDDCSDDDRLYGHEGEDCYRLRERLVPVDQLVDQLVSHKWADEVIRFGGILGPLDRSCDETLPSSRYVEAVSRVGGSISRICDEDFTPALHDLGAIASGILEQFTLSEPAHVDSIEVSVDGILVLPDAIDGWTYEAASQLLTFHGAAIPERGSEIVVEYEVGVPAR